jgi:hypothetical protein
MKSTVRVLLFVMVICGLAACAKDTSQEAAGTAGQPETTVNAPSSAPGTPNSAVPKPAEKAANSTPPKPAVARTFEIPAGTEVSVFLTQPISTAKNKTGDTFTATIADPIIVNGETVVERGVSVQGKVVDAEGSGRVKGKANIRLALTSILAGEKAYPIVTQPFAAEADSTKGRDAGVIAGGGGVGAAIGAIAGGKKGAATGAIIGGAAGTGAVLATKGKEVEFNSETKLKFALEKSAELPKIR